MTATRYRNRITGVVESERVFGGSGLDTLYGTTLGRAFTDHVLTRRWPNLAYGLWQRAPWTARQVPSFVRTLGIDPTEAERPLRSYRSLDEFFTRRLRSSCRPIDRTADHLVSPCDGRVLVFPSLDGGDLPIKHSHVTLDRLIGDPKAAARFRGGGALVVRLAPADYHWFHFPDGGVAGPSRTLSGKLHSVHPIALRAGAQSFDNARQVTPLSTRRFGELLLVEVGALLVGTIVQQYAPGPVERGAAKGYFRFGGSTVVLVSEPGRVQFDQDLIDASASGLETLVRMGTRIGRAPQPTSASLT